MSGYSYYTDSLASSQGVTYFMVRSEEDNAKFLGILGDVSGFEGFQEAGSGAWLCMLTPENLALLRERLPWLKAQALGIQTTAGFGDRLGLATPGHVNAVKETNIAPIFAQQSVRENARTRRTPQQVMDDATWGVFQTGWQRPWGADADHLKTTDDIDSFYAAGFTFFTIDPGDHVDNAAQTDTVDTLRGKVDQLPWGQLNTALADVQQAYLGQVFEIEDFVVSFDEITLLRALAKYGRSIAHTARMAQHLAQRAGGQPYDLEISVDETETPTSPAEHFFVASELRRMGIYPVSLAPRFVGRFEKGVDYIGDLATFEREFGHHAAIARHLGGYRLSLHSGSDKFSIYGIAAEKTNGLLHLKTAGTSYLEALRVVAQTDESLFRNILQLAIERYEVDRASYHVSADVNKVPQPGNLSDADLVDLLNQFDARQVFHVTFGATLDRFGPGLCAVLRDHEDIYYNFLASHFQKHLAPIAKYSARNSAAPSKPMGS